MPSIDPYRTVMLPDCCFSPMLSLGEPTIRSSIPSSLKSPDIRVEPH